MATLVAMSMLTAGMPAMASPGQTDLPAPTAVQSSVRDTADILRIEIDETIADADLIEGWIRSRNPDVFDQPSMNEGYEQWIAISVAGATYDYEVLVMAIRDGEPIGKASAPAHCECTVEQLLELIDRHIDGSVVRLQQATAVEHPPPPPPPPKPRPEPTRRPSPTHDRVRTLRAPGYIGIVAMALGAGAVGVGVELLTRPDAVRHGAGGLEAFTVRPPGIATVATGGVAVATGVSLLIADVVRNRRRNRAMALVPTLGGSTRGGVSIVRRF
ncbi:hypothetical protein OEB96_45125 [Paraliomyxa miuraensis]|nr:hypothetical protein [Paraliomyxa miuraensis]